MKIAEEMNINNLAEFSDPDLEKEFFQQDMTKAIRFIKPIVLMLGVLNTLFFIPDYFLINDQGSFFLVASGRIIFLFMVLGLFLRIDYIKNCSVLANWITVYEIICSLLFLFVFLQYESPNYLIQAFGVMVIIIVVFMVPNRWINMILVSLFVSGGFIAMAAYLIGDVPLSEFLAGIVYIAIVIFLCSIIAFKDHYHKRIQYINDKELIRLSTIDHLSGAFNRAKLDEELKKWIEYSKRYGTQLSLIILDFDDFKQINDTYGHLIGDKVIVSAAELIRKNIRDTDVFARWGGEEFILLLPNTGKASALELAERLRQEIEEYFSSKGGRVTCSFGVVQLDSDDDRRSFLQKADQRLYLAKKEGKNVVMG